MPIGDIGNSGNENAVGDALDKEDPPAKGNGNGNGSSASGNGSSSTGTGTGNGTSANGNDAASAGNGSPVIGSGITSPRNTGASQVTTAVLTMTPTEARSALKQLAGEAYASTASVLQGQSDTVRTLPLDHLRGNLDAPALAGQPTAQLGSPSSDALPQSGAHPVWAQVFGNWGSLGGDGNASRVSQSAGGLFVGTDAAVGGGWRLGGAVGYTGSHSSVSDISARTDVDSYTATVFGGRNFPAGPGHIRFMAGAAYTWHDIDTKRNVAAGSLNQQLKSSYNASSTQVFTELGYHLPLGDAYSIEPYAGLAWNQLRTRDFQESGGSAALRGSGTTDDVTSTTLGLRGAWQFESNRAPGRITASLGWRHAMGDVKPRQDLSLIHI